MANASPSMIAYLVPDLGISFWDYVRRGIEAAAKEGNFGVLVLESHQQPDKEMENAKAAIAAGVRGIIMSPIDADSSPSVLDYCKEHGIPVVLADLGTRSGDYLSYVKSDNASGAYGVGIALARQMKERGWNNEPVGIIAIRHEENREERFAGFRAAMRDEGVGKTELVRHLTTHNQDYCYILTKEMLASSPDVRGIFVMSDHPSYGALRAIREAGRGSEIIVGAFDGSHKLVDLIRKGEVVGTGMQKCYEIGTRSAELLLAHFRGEPVPKVVTVPTIVVTAHNLTSTLPEVSRSVFAGEPA